MGCNVSVVVEQAPPPASPIESRRPSIVEEMAIDFARLMHDEAGREALCEFAKKEHSEENILFYDRVQQFRKKYAYLRRLNSKDYELVQSQGVNPSPPQSRRASSSKDLDISPSPSPLTRSRSSFVDAFSRRSSGDLQLGVPVDDGKGGEAERKGGGAEGKKGGEEGKGGGAETKVGGEGKKGLSGEVASGALVNEKSEGSSILTTFSLPSLSPLPTPPNTLLYELKVSSKDVVVITEEEYRRRVREDALRLIEEFLRDGSEMQVTLPNTNPFRNGLDEAKVQPSANMFDPMCRVVYRTIEQDIFPRFRRSTGARELLKNFPDFARRMTGFTTDRVSGGSRN